jgi:hypothetical protein
MGGGGSDLRRIYKQGRLHHKGEATSLRIKMEVCMNWLKRLLEMVRNWYAGDMIPVNGWVGGFPRRPVVARALDWCLTVMRKEWRWLIGWALTILGMVVTFFCAK